MSDQNLLRTSLLPGIWKNINDNARHLDQFRLFEIGRAIHPDREVPRFTAALFSKEEAVSGLLEERQQHLHPHAGLRRYNARGDCDGRQMARGVDQDDLRGTGRCGGDDHLDHQLQDGRSNALA